MSHTRDPINYKVLVYAKATSLDTVEVAMSNAKKITVSKGGYRPYHDTIDEEVE